jgi:AcrR family transcriptional regulator
MSRIDPMPNRASARTRDKVIDTVRALLSEGAFHESTVEKVAERAGVSRATLYTHFGSRTGLVDSICERLNATPALQEIRKTTDAARLIELSVEFWAGDERIFEQLYGAAAVDPAAGDFVERQRRDRTKEIRRIATSKEQQAQLLLLTSFETYRELRRGVGLPQAEVTATLQRLLR